MHRQSIARWTFGTLALSLPGLWLCNRAGEHFLHSRIGGALQMFFAVAACVALLSFAVIILASKKPAREEMAARVASGEIDPTKMPPAERAAFSAAYRPLPRWLYLPFLTIAVILTILAALGIVGMLIWMIVS